MRRKAVRQTKRNQPLASRIRDPIEIVLRVLMARGLPMELARKVLFGSGEAFLVTPLAQMIKKEMSPLITTCASWFRVFDNQRHHVVMSGECMCQYTDSPPEQAAINHCRNMFTQFGRKIPISLAAACHSQTIYQWRGTHSEHDYRWIRDNHDWNRGQLWQQRPDGYCSMTLLYYRFWRTMNDRTDYEEMPIDPREYSLVRELKETTLQQLRKMFSFAIGVEHARLKLLPNWYTHAEIVRCIVAAN